MRFKKRFGTLIITFSVSTLLIGAATDKVNIEDNTYKVDESDINLNFSSYIEATETLKNIQAFNDIKINNEINIIENIINNKYMTLVNKENLIDKSYKPDSLVESSLVAKSNKEERMLDKEVSEKLTDMFNDAKKDGIILKGISGYRSYNTQQSIYKSRKGSKYVALPGASEHQTGYAIDILGKSYDSLTVGFEETEEFKWLSENCYKYGFILRYQKNTEKITGIPYEPWHYRYVGSADSANEVMKSGLPLEEFIEKANDRLLELKSIISKN